MNKEDLKREIGDLIWKMATNLVHGGKVSSVQFMDYTLGALFYHEREYGVLVHLKPSVTNCEENCQD